MKLLKSTEINSLEIGKQVNLILYCIDSLGITYKYQTHNHLAFNISNSYHQKFLK